MQLLHRRRRWTSFCIGDDRFDDNKTQDWTCPNGDNSVCAPHAASMFIRWSAGTAARAVMLTHDLSAQCSIAAGPSSPLLLVVLVGIPGSGKSTLANALVSTAPQPPAGRRWCRVSQDVLGNRRKCIAVAERALGNGEHVLVDRCNFDQTQRAHWLGLRGPRPDLKLAVYLPVPPAEARRRVLNRGAHEGGVDTLSMSDQKIAGIVARMQDDLRPPSTAEGFDEVLRLSAEESNGLSHTAIVDRVLALAGGTSASAQRPLDT